MSHETRELYRIQGRMLLAIMATLAEYERELINERVRAGVISAQKRGVRFGPAPMEESVARERVSTARRLMAEGKTAAHAAKTVGWSKATLYRYLKTYEGDLPAKDAVNPKRASGRSRYVNRESLPSRQ